MAAIGIASRSTSLFRTATRRSLISSRARLSVPNPNSPSSSRFNASSLRQTRIEGSVPRFLRRELSTHQPFHSVVAAACLVSKLPSDVTSYEGSSFGMNLPQNYYGSFHLGPNLIPKQEEQSL